MYKMIKDKEMKELGLLLTSIKAPFHFNADPDPCRSRKYLQELLIQNKYQLLSPPPFFWLNLMNNSEINFSDGPGFVNHHVDQDTIY